MKNDKFMSTGRMTPTEADKLLNEVEGACYESHQVLAYNFLIDYIDNPEWFESHEGQRLLNLSVEVLKNI